MMGRDGWMEREERGKDVRVLMVSIGAFENGPIAPEMSPIPMC